MSVGMTHLRESESGVPLGQNSLLRLYGSQISRSEPEKDFINNLCHNAT